MRQPSATGRVRSRAPTTSRCGRRDWADNVDLTPDTYDWEIDITVVDEGTGPDSVAPDTRISAKPSDSTSTSATFAFAGTDNATPGLSLSFECSLDGAPFAACTTPVDYDELGVGSHNFAVRAIDRATVPNADPTPATHTWLVLETPVDTTPPETTVDSGPDPITVLTDTTFTFSSDDPAATFECSLDGGGPGPPAPRVTRSGLIAGPQQFQVRATDAAGNTDLSPGDVRVDDQLRPRAHDRLLRHGRDAEHPAPQQPQRLPVGRPRGRRRRHHDRPGRSHGRRQGHRRRHPQRRPRQRVDQERHA